MVLPSSFQPYGISGQNTGVLGYALHDGSIHLLFRNSLDVYVYDEACTGPQHVAVMKHLAASGRGLSTYVSQHVQHRYAHKYRLPPDPAS